MRAFLISASLAYLLQKLILDYSFQIFDQEESVDLFTEENLRQLADVQGRCVTIYMPTFRTGSDTQQNPIRYKNLVGEAEVQLVNMGLRHTDAAEFIYPARRLLTNGNFWMHMSDGLAVFLSENFLQVFRVPYSFNQLSLATDRFHFKPILGMLSGKTLFYVLTLNMSGPKLYAGNRFSIRRIHSDLLPKSMVETLGFDNKEKNTQFYSKPSGMGGNPPTVFGYGNQTDKTKQDLIHYFTTINNAVTKILADSNAPLITAGIDYHNPLYRGENSYPHLLEECIEKNLENAEESEIHRLAWPVVLPHFQKGEKKTFSFFEQLKGEHSPVATEDLKTIVQGSVNGRIETLFIADGSTHKWGFFEPSSQDITVHEQKEPGDEDLLETAAINTILKGGTVFVLKPEQIPATKEAAAVLRF